MNYFQHHIGDYAEATSHLTFVEDAAYSRMIRKYYATEKPMPVDVKAVQRLIGARTKEEREAVQVVLEEFFNLQADGWHNTRCDEDILQYQEGEPEREVKKANEDNRVKRHREERARLFKVITDAGQHAPWNIGMLELRAMVKALQVTGPETPPATVPPEPVTPPVTAPATPATATHTPYTNHQSPNTNHQGLSPGEIPSEADASGAKAPPPDEPPLTDQDRVYAIGVTLLTAEGVADKNARSFLALQCKQHGAAAVVRALQRCAEVKPVQAIPWLQAVLKVPGGPGKPDDRKSRQLQTAALMTGATPSTPNSEEAFDVESRVIHS